MQLENCLQMDCVTLKLLILFHVSKIDLRKILVKMAFHGIELAFNNNCRDAKAYKPIKIYKTEKIVCM